MEEVKRLSDIGYVDEIYFFPRVFYSLQYLHPKRKAALWHFLFAFAFFSIIKRTLPLRSILELIRSLRGATNNRKITAHWIILKKSAYSNARPLLLRWS